VRACLGLCAALALWFSGTGAAAAITVALHPEAVQPGMRLTLAQVADVEGATGLRELALPARGKVGDSIVFTRTELARYIGAAHPGLANALRWSGATRVTVRRTGIAVQPQEYLGWAREQLLAHFAGSGGRFEVQPKGNYRPLRVPEGARAITARFDGGQPRRATRVWLDIAVDRQHYASIAVLFDVRWWRPALVLKQSGQARQHLRPAMVATAMADVSLARGHLVDTPEQLRGMRLRHAVAEGRALTDDDIEATPAVETGARVNAYTRVRRVLIQTLVIAQQDGNIGQRIEAAVAGSNEKLTVEVIGENRAMVSDNQKQ
jgi:flagella basal body P-ring formation protein FlgA